MSEQLLPELFAEKIDADGVLGDVLAEDEPAEKPGPAVAGGNKQPPAAE